MNRSKEAALLVSFLVLSPALKADRSTEPPPRVPKGIYAYVNIDEYEGVQKQMNPAITPVELESYFDDLYNRLLANSAVSGIALGATWKRLEPNAPASSKGASLAPIRGQDDPRAMASKVPPSSDGYDWSWTDNLFLQVRAYNATHPDMPPKTIQLGVPPGFNSPKWLLDELPSCNYLFDGSKEVPNCGKATFSGFVEGGRKKVSGVTKDIPLDLPMPWNPTYKTAWETFLTALAARYRSYPEFVSIGVAGPTASSGEMILPSNRNTKGPQIGGKTPNEMWSLLLKHFFTNSKLQNSDQAFVDEWEKAIDMYGKVFSGITLAVNYGSGLPDFSPAPTSCSALNPNCVASCPKLNSDCVAETDIMNYFLETTVGGTNAKAGSTDGMKGFGPYIKKPELGEPAVKWLTQNTSAMGGTQFATSFSQFPVKEGYTSKNPPAGATLSPEQAAYNVLLYYFTGTPGGGAYHQAMGGAALNYLQIYGPDIEYANANSYPNPDLYVDVQEANGPVTDSATTFTTVSTTVQQLLIQASDQLLLMAKP